MKTLTAAVMYDGEERSLAMVEALLASEALSEVLLVIQGGGGEHLPPLSKHGKLKPLAADAPMGEGLNRLLDRVSSDYLLLILPGEAVHLGGRTLERFTAVAADTGASLIYSDFRDDLGGGLSDHPLIDYQTGSIRDSFDFGSLVIISKSAAEAALRKYGPIIEGLAWGGLYDLRLKLSLDSNFLRVPEPLYTRTPRNLRASGERQFDYVDPQQRSYQVEMETVATEHLKRMGAYLAPEFKQLPPGEKNFPVRASIIIPVRNRERTIEDAVRSALSQKTEFDFNVLVVDNHSTDGTTAKLSELARDGRRLVHWIPPRTDLGIGGCWNEAIYSAHCGQYAVQLDSDDLYADEHTLERVVEKLEQGPYAMVIGSYTIVDFDLQEMAPGLISHREWTRENGRNNALRINGLGAPRAFYVPVLRRVGLPNVSYGEDYAAALRISRDYEIGRIYDSIYYARRWEGNSDAALPLQTSNRYDAYKDHLRTVEIFARKRINDEMGRQDHK
jgi:glycosyl transferase family 2